MTKQVTPSGESQMMLAVRKSSLCVWEREGIKRYFSAALIKMIESITLAVPFPRRSRPCQACGWTFPPEHPAVGSSRALDPWRWWRKCHREPPGGWCSRPSGNSTLPARRKSCPVCPPGGFWRSERCKKRNEVMEVISKHYGSSNQLLVSAMWKNCEHVEQSSGTQKQRTLRTKV